MTNLTTKPDSLQRAVKIDGHPMRSENGNYKHGRYTKEVASTRRWLREATHMLRDLNKRPG